jgi:hypothetical protein
MINEILLTPHRTNTFSRGGVAHGILWLSKFMGVVNQTVIGKVFARFFCLPIRFCSSGSQTAMSPPNEI